MLSLHAHTETFPVRIAHVPVRSYATRVIHVVLWMCFPSKDRACSQPDSENTSLFVVSLGAYRLQANACRSVPVLGPPLCKRGEKDGRRLRPPLQSQRVVGVASLRSNP